MTLPNSPDKKKKILEALNQTASGDQFNPEATESLAASAENKLKNEEASEQEIKENILETLESNQIQDNFVDFYPEDEDKSFESSDTLDDNPFDSLDESFADNQLQSDYIPGRYKVKSLLGKGANGTVFDVVDNNLERSVAVKFLNPKKAHQHQNISLFINEAKNTAQLNHPNILPIHDLNFTDGAIPYYTMRKVGGQTLRDLISASQETMHPLISNYSKKIDIIIKVCDAITYGHDKNTIHGDIKPANIIIGQHGEVTLLDWGVGASHNNNQLQSNVYGTPMYMAPEQAQKQAITKHSDIYCIGSTLLHLLTHRPPLGVADAKSFWDRKRSGYYKDFTKEEARLVPAPLISIVHKCLANNISDRYADIKQLKQDLLAFQGGERVSAHRDSTWSLALRLYAKNKIALNLVLATIIASMLFAYMIYAEKQKELSEWKIVYSEDFDHYTNEDIVQNWKITSFHNWLKENKIEPSTHTDHSWFVKNGKLTNTKPSDGFRGTQNISPNINITGPIKFTAEISAQKGTPLCNVFIGGRNRFEGYTIHVGQWGGAKQVTLTKGEELIPLTYSRIPIDIKSGDTVHYTVVKDGDIIRFFMNRQLVLEYRDPVPLVGHEHQYIGFENDQKYIDNLTIFNKAPPEKIKSITAADTFLSRGFNALALDSYDSLMIDHATDPEINALALFRSAQCLFNLNNFFEARVRLINFLNAYKNHPYYIHALTSLTNVFLETFDFQKADESLKKVGEQFPAHPQTKWVFDKAVSQLGISINLSERSYIEKNISQNILDMAKSIARWEQYGQFEIREYANISKSRCAFVLFRLGYREDLCTYFPQSKYTLRHYTRTHDIQALRKSFPKSNAVVHYQVRNQQFDQLFSLNPKRKISLYNLWEPPQTVHRLLAHAKSIENDAVQKECLKHLKILNAYWVDLNQFIIDGKTKEALQYLHDLGDNQFRYNLRFIYNLIGKQDLVISDKLADPATVVLAHAANAISAWRNGDLAAIKTHLSKLSSYKGDYAGKTISCCVLEGFINWSQDRDTNRFLNSLREFRDHINHRYSNKVHSQLSYLLGDISFEELSAVPINQNAAGTIKEYIHVFAGIKYELDGNTDAALRAYEKIKTPMHNIQTSDAYLFARAREWLLSNDK